MLGRLLRPYALAVSLATAVITYACVQEIAVGALLSGSAGKVTAGVGCVSVLLLWVGWWVDHERWMRWGLFLTTGVWTSVATILAIDIGLANVNTALAACWAIASGGAWLLEAADRGAP